jgi:BA14K-like protein
MEPMMISLKVLSTAAAIVLVLPMAASTASFAENPNSGKANSAARGGGGGVRAGANAQTSRFGGGGAAAPRAFSGGGVRTTPGAPVTQAGPGSGNWRGGEGWRGNEGWRDGARRDRDRDRGFIPGAVAGAVIGGAIASQSYGYYGGPVYYGPGYTDDQYYDGGPAVAPAPVGDDAIAYCMQNYSSYDPGSGTYLGNDGYRHPCP